MYASQALAWLMPNHYLPWLSAWNDGVAIFGLILLMLHVMVHHDSVIHISRLLVIFTMLVIFILVLQLIIGRLLFYGDAWMVLLYLGSWLSAVTVGVLLSRQHTKGLGGLDFFFLALVMSACLSVGVAMVQWTGAVNLGFWVVDLPPGGRPFGNVAQPNQFNTICFLGICSLLWLHQQRRVDGPVLCMGVAFLLMGMVMSQSRTGWLQVAMLVAGGMAMNRQAGLRLGRVQFLALGVLFAFWVVTWPAVNEWLLLSAGRSLADQMQSGMRWPFWLSMLDAIGREPLWGYGWQQVSVAQQRIALDHPSVGVQFDHSHNIVLDFLLWCGIPMGGLMVAMLGVWLWRYVRRCCDARVFCMLLVVLGVLIHGFLEFPLEYAYILIPLGLVMGGIEGIAGNQREVVVVSRGVAWILAAALAFLFSVVAVEYAKVEDYYRTMRIEARLGGRGGQAPVPQLRLLTQLEAFLRFSRAEAAVGMSMEQVNWMRNVSQRFGYPMVQLRFALAAGLNGRSGESRETLAQLCRIHTPQRCLEAREGWKALQARYPQLNGISISAPSID